MPYCAKCLVEYVEGTTQCEDCGASLLPGSPPGTPPPVDLRKAATAQGNPEFLSLWAGTGVAEIQAAPAAKVMERLIGEMEEALGGPGRI